MKTGFQKIFFITLFLSLTFCARILAQEQDLSHQPAHYNQDYFLNEPVHNLTVRCLPNPTYDTTTFKYELKEDAEVSLKIYNDMGHKVDEPLNEFREAGIYNIKWSPLNLKLKGGVYYARVGIGEKFQLLKVRYIE